MAYEDDGEQEDGKTVQRIDVVEIHNADWQLPAAGCWVSGGDLSKLTLALPEHAQVLEQWFREREQVHEIVQRRPLKPTYNFVYIIYESLFTNTSIEYASREQSFSNLNILQNRIVCV